MASDVSALNEIQQLIFHQLLETFPLIDPILGDHLKAFIPKFTSHLQSTPSRARNLQKMLKTTTAPLEVNRLPRTDMIRLVFEAAALRILYCLPESEHLFWADKATFLASYEHMQEFKDLPDTELNKLLDFRNMMVVALQLMPAKLEHLVDLVVSSV